MSKIEEIKSRYPELNISLFDVINLLDTTDTKKYVEVYCKILLNVLNSKYYVDKEKSVITLLTESITEGDKFVISELESFLINNEANLIKNKDIQSYKTIEAIIEENEEVERVKELKELERQIIRHYKDDIYEIIEPLTFEASKKYGYQTKWCTTMEEHYFKKHTKDNHCLLYIMNKKISKKTALYYDDELINYWSETNENIDFHNLVLRGVLNDEIGGVLLDIIKYKKENRSDDKEFIINDDFNILNRPIAELPETNNEDRPIINEYKIASNAEKEFYRNLLQNLHRSRNLMKKTQ